MKTGKRLWEDEGKTFFCKLQNTAKQNQVKGFPNVIARPCDHVTIAVMTTQTVCVIAPRQLDRAKSYVVGGKFVVRFRVFSPGRYVKH